MNPDHFVRLYARRASWQLETLLLRARALSGGEHYRTLVFTRIYRRWRWGRESNSVSGPGSDLEQTASLREQLPLLLAQLNVRILLDAPCGDYGWMSTVTLPAGVEEYIGVDIVPQLVHQSTQRYGDPLHTFLCRDLCQDSLPRADLVLCRDCLVHLSYADIAAALAHLRATGAHYLLTTTFPGHPFNRDITTGGWRTLNFEAPPFSWPAPLQRIGEGTTQAGYTDKSLGLWSLADLPAFMPS
jgi:hypothetical protein